MRNIYSDVVQFKGSHYDFGFMQGQLLKGSLILKNREAQYNKRKQRYIVQETEVKNALQSLAPGIWEELLGLKNGLKWPMEDILNAFGGYLIDAANSGCSVYITPDYMVRNYDFHPFTYEGKFVLFEPTNQSYATIGPTQHIVGRMDGMNEKGLAIAYNFVNRKNPGIGFIPNMITRIVLESCANVDQAVTLLKEIPHFHSFNYIMIDADGKHIVVEATPRNIKVRDSIVCTNHFEMLKHENRYHLDDSFRRQEQILTQKENINHPYQAFRMFNDRDRGIFADRYQNSSGTIHTSMYFAKDRKMWFALGGDREPVIIDFTKWVKGEPMNMTRILGEVETDLPFLHMDEKNAH